MARMIPPQVGDDVESAAERRVFDLLNDNPDTSGWTVLHSLELARRRTGPYGEIDFVVMIPNEGIVCLEVKGGPVSRENGLWRTRDRRGRVKPSKDPFKQAKESMFALRDNITAHFGQWSPESKCPIGYAVVFTDVECPPATPEFQRSDAIDVKDLERPIAESINRVVRNRPRDRQPHDDELKAILNYLRPNFDLVVKKSVSLGRTEAEIVSLTEEQYERLDQLEDNDRCRFEGAAGTGKTLLALEYAQRESRAGAKVLFVCFNRLLGNSLKEQTKNTKIKAGTWHSVLREIILDSKYKDEFLQAEQAENDKKTSKKALFSEIYPLYGEAALTEIGAPFDVLVMDEAQDLFKQTILPLVDRAIKGGLANGRWGIFGDFTRQAIYSSPSEPDADLSDYCEHYVKARLTLNCRNTQKIADEMAMIGGFDTRPFRLNREPGEPVDLKRCSTPSDMRKGLEDVISDLMTEDIKMDKVMILSMYRLENSALASVKQICGLPLVDSSRQYNAARNHIKFSTIHAFKGLESPVVILVDVDKVEDDESQSLLYVGMSRARSHLIMMSSEAAHKSIYARKRTWNEKNPS